MTCRSSGSKRQGDNEKRICSNLDHPVSFLGVLVHGEKLGNNPSEIRLQVIDGRRR